MRHLVLNLEREAIDLAHVWPKTYPSLEEGREKCCCYWFVGLVIKSSLTANQQQDEDGSQKKNLDLTTPIKKFSELVMSAAHTIGCWKEGMKVAADYKKRKQLSQYLPPDERHKLKVERIKPVATSMSSEAMDSPKTSTGKRRPSDPDFDGENSNSLSGDNTTNSQNMATMAGNENNSNGETQPPIKKSNTSAETPAELTAMPMSTSASPAPPPSSFVVPSNDQPMLNGTNSSLTSSASSTAANLS